MGRGRREDGEDRPILGESHASDGSRVTSEIGNICLLLQVPDLHHTTRTHTHTNHT